MIVPHFGAGFFREALMAADQCPTIHLDTSSSNSWIRFDGGQTLEGVFRSALAVVGASRLLFGTDSSFFPRGWQAGIYEEQQRIMGSLGVSVADRAAIFGGNFDGCFQRSSLRRADGSGHEVHEGHEDHEETCSFVIFVTFVIFVSAAVGRLSAAIISGHAKDTRSISPALPLP